MDGVAAFFGGDLAEDGQSDEGDVADDVEYFVSDKFVVEPERRFVQHSVGRQNDGVIEQIADALRVTITMPAGFAARDRSRGCPVSTNEFPIFYMPVWLPWMRHSSIAA